MAGREIASVAPALHDDLSFTRGDQLHHDLRLVPAVGCLTLGEAEQHRAPVGQQLRPVNLFAFTGRNDEFRRASIRRHALDANVLTEQDRVVTSPAGAECSRRRTESDRCASGDGYLLQLSGRGKIADPLPIGRDEGTGQIL